MKDKKIILTSACALIALLVVGGFLLFNKPNDKDKDSKTTPTADALKFKEEYKKVDDNNVFVYRDMEDIIKILENGRGVVYLGFPECPWCQAYVPYLNDVAKEVGIDKIYYYNILNDRKEETDNYKKILELLGEYVEYNDEGNKRIYAPTVIFVKDGEIIGMDSETAKDTKGFEKPEDYWTDDEVKDLKTRLRTLAEQVKETTCSDCNK